MLIVCSPVRNWIGVISLPFGDYFRPTETTIAQLSQDDLSNCPKMIVAGARLPDVLHRCSAAVERERPWRRLPDQLEDLDLPSLRRDGLVGLRVCARCLKDAWRRTVCAAAISSARSIWVHGHHSLYFGAGADPGRRGFRRTSPDLNQMILAVLLDATAGRCVRDVPATRRASSLIPSSIVAQALSVAGVRRRDRGMISAETIAELERAALVHSRRSRAHDKLVRDSCSTIPLLIPCCRSDQAEEGNRIRRQGRRSGRRRYMSVAIAKR